jgi:cytochrome c5
MRFSKYLVATGSVLMAASAFASGEDTYKAVCASCHAKGVANAPKVGDKAKWAPLIAEGQVTLTAHGYVGVRAMPPKGGKPDLSVADFSAAVNHMVNLSGGNWKTPDSKTLAGIQAEIADRQKRLAAK